MRIIYDALTGADNTSLAQAALLNSRSLVTQYLYTIGFCPPWTAGGANRAYYAFTDAEFPILVKTLQLFAVGVSTLTPTAGLTYRSLFPMSHDKLEYGIGFEDHPVTVSMNVDDSKNYSAVLNVSAGTLAAPNIASFPVSLTLKQAFFLDVFRDCPLWIHQAVFTDFPDKGGTFLGTTLMFRGFIRKVDLVSSSIKLTVSSLMDVFQQVQVPTQTLTPNSRTTPYGLGPIIVDGNHLTFTITPLTSTSLQFTISSVSFTYNQLRDCWFTSIGLWEPFGFVTPPAINGLPPAPSWRILGNEATVGGSGGPTTIYFEKTPILPASNTSPLIFAPNSLSTGAPGFPYVPPPEFSA